MQKKRDHMCESLKMAGLNPIIPQGGYFVCADATEFWNKSGLQSVEGEDDGMKLCKWMSKEIGILPSPCLPFTCLTIAMNLLEN
jgi:kynurenine--oxoglutarate transaminase/cysteine-S-conjugate beta-lyase/glutamine--phenylpyruvate transaminase